MKEIYRILSGSLGQELRVAQVTNNLANVGTTGFKKDSSAFVDYLRDQMAAQGEQTADSATLNDPNREIYPVLGLGYTDFASGPLQRTDRQLDVALDGAGFFQVRVEGEKQPMLSRAGNFSMSQTGELLTTDGRPVLDDGGGAIRLDPKAGRIEIEGDGQIRVDGATVGRLSVVTVPDPTKLQKYGAGLYRIPAGVATQPATATVRQGMLESSNVNAVDEMVRLIQLERNYGSSQKIAQMIDETYAKRIDAANG